MEKWESALDGSRMKVVILAGGKGTRISEESVLRPKPMVSIGGRPMLWHIMKIYECFGFREFIICCGYKGESIKKYFVRYGLSRKKVDFILSEIRDNGKTMSGSDTEQTEKWNVICANTGLETLTAGRIRQIQKYVGSDNEFMITYGDGVADINIRELIHFHHAHGKILTISATQPEGRFGAIRIDEDGTVTSFQEKARKSQSFVNIGFMVADRRLFDYLGDGNEMLEQGPFNRLVADKQIAAYKHPGFWSPMDNIHDREYLEKLWDEGAPWVM